MTDTAHYQRNLAGEKVAIHDGDPRKGYYWLRRHREGKRLPVCIFPDPETGQLVARVGPDMADVAETWLSCSKHPVGRSAALHAFNTGRWPDEAPAPIGSNHPPSDDPLEAITRELEAESERVNAWVAENHEGATAANMAANWLVQLRGLEKKTVDAFTVEKAPILAEQKRVDSRWRPAKELAASIKKRLDEAYQAIGRKEQARLRAIAEAKAKEEAEKRRQEQEAELARLALEHNMPVDHGPIRETADEPIQVEVPKIAFGGATGSKIGIRSVPPKALVEDWGKAAAYFANNATLRTLVQKLCDHAAKDGHEVPGVRVVREE